MRKQLFFLLMMLLPMMAMAYDAEIDGIYYNFSGTEAIVTYGGDNAYTGDIIIPEAITYNETEYSVASIGDYAFWVCSGVTSITIPNSVRSIGTGAFEACNNLTSVHISDIGAWCAINFGTNPFPFTHSLYLNDEEIKDLVIPNGVTCIGDWAFANCSGITSVTMANSVTTIGLCAFAGCSGLTSITIPNSVMSIGAGAFEATAWYDNQPDGVVYAGNHVYKYKGTMPDNTSIVINEGSFRISDSAFTNCTGLISITIPNSVISIGQSAFRGCTALTSVAIPNSVTSIGQETFWGCTALTSVTIPNSVTSIGQGTFWGCTALTSVIIPNSITSIGDGGFSQCSSLTSVSIPNSVTSIGEGAFYGCSELTSLIVDGGNTVYDSRENCNAIIETASNTLLYGCTNTIIPNSVTSIADCAFSCRLGLTSITIPNSVTTIGNGAFWGCSNLTSITIPNSVTTIGETAFGDCSGLTSISIPNSVSTIERTTFWKCSSLASVTIPNSVTTIGEYAFLQCTSLTSVTIPNSVTTIGNGAFSSCTSLASVTIPNSVTTIGENAFLTCDGLTSITIPNSVTTIGNGAFLACNGLTSVKVLMETPIAIEYNTFSNRNNITLYVPIGCVDDYKAADVWKDFKEILVYDYLNTSDLNIRAGDSNFVEIGLTNEDTGLVAFQMDLTLPEGIGIDKTGCTLSDRITDENQELTIGKLESGAYRITSTSLSLTPISGNDGTLLSLKLTSEDGCIGGQAAISNIIFSTAESEKAIMSDKTFDISILYNLTYKVDGEVYQTNEVVYNTPLIPIEEPTKVSYTFGGWSELPKTMPNHDVEITGRFYLYGDVNTDEAVDVVDVVDIARFVVATPSVSFREKLADLNFDNTVNIADAVTLVNYIAGDQNFARATEFYDYDQCQLQLLNHGTNALSFCITGEADFTAFQFEVELPENIDITAMRINSQRMNEHQLLYNKVADNRYRVAVLSLSNEVFKGNEGELLNISIDGQPTNEISISKILFVTINGRSITFDDISLSEATGIANVNVNDGNNVIYDLQGRKLSNAQRGVNIIDGKKIVVK